MSALQTLCTVVGAIVIVISAPTLVVLALGWISTRIDTRRTRYMREGAERERSLLAGDARWFSEDEETMWLLENFARRDVGDVREEWRRRRRERAEEAERLLLDIYRADALGDDRVPEETLNDLDERMLCILTRAGLLPAAADREG